MKKSKIFLVLLVSMIGALLFSMSAAFAGGGLGIDGEGGIVYPPVPSNPGSQEIQGGVNFWWLSADPNDDLTLVLIQANFGGSGNADRVVCPRYENNKTWWWSHSANLRMNPNLKLETKNKERGWAKVVGVYSNFVICESHTYKGKTYAGHTLEYYANKIKEKYNVTVTVEQIETVISEWLQPRIVQHTSNNYNKDYVKYVIKDDGSRLLTINIWSAFEEIFQEYEETVEEPGSTKETESKYVLVSLHGDTTGTMYSNATAAYNDTSTFSYSDTKSNSYIIDPKKAWENSNGTATYSRSINYSTVSSNTTVAEYVKIERWRTTSNTKVTKTTHKHKMGDPCNEMCTSTVSYVDGTTSEWHYQVSSEPHVFLTKTENVNRTVYLPTYSIYNWMDLTSETFVSDRSKLTTANGSKPTTFKADSGLAGENLKMTLTTGKSAGQKFGILSDNNAKGFSMTFTGILGIPGLSSTKPTAVGKTYFIDGKLYFGATKGAAASTPLISVQRVTPSGGSEKTTRDSVAITNNMTFGVKYRSIKYGLYTLGDTLGSNYWYAQLNLGTTNNLGSKFYASAPWSLPTKPTNDSLTLTGSALDNNAVLTAGFIQPVLQGEIDVKDVAGN